MSNTEIIERLANTRTENPNRFYDVVHEISRATGITREDIISLYNDSLDEEEDS